MDDYYYVTFRETKDKSKRMKAISTIWVYMETPDRLVPDNEPESFKNRVIRELEDWGYEEPEVIQCKSVISVDDPEALCELIDDELENGNQHRLVGSANQFLDAARKCHVDENHLPIFMRTVRDILTPNIMPE